METHSLDWLDYLSFGRTIDFAFVLPAQTIPLLFPLLLSSPPFIALPWSDSDNIMLLLALAVITSSLVFYTVVWTCNQTYSTSLRRTRNQILSAVLYLTLGLVATGFSYLFFVYPHSGLPTSPSDIGVGVVLGTAYAEYILLLQSRNIWAQSNMNQMEEMVQDFNQAVNSVSKGNAEATEYTEDVVQSGRWIQEELGNSTFSETEELTTNLREWLDDFEGNGLAQQTQLAGNGEISEITNDLCILAGS